MKTKPIYIVTLMENLTNYNNHTVAWFYDKKDAFKVLNQNSCDLNEHLYEYAVVEKLHEGIYPVDMKPQWFKWDEDKEKYFKIGTPESKKRICAFYG